MKINKYNKYQLNYIFSQSIKILPAFSTSSPVVTWSAVYAELEMVDDLGNASRIKN